MGQKFLIVNTEAFSPSGIKGNKTTGLGMLPEIVRRFLKANPDPFIVLDESSKIKTTAPAQESKKSTRTRLIKMLNMFGERMALTGTLMSKSPLNVVDQYQFLDGEAYPEGMYALAEQYCVMMTIRVGRGRRVLIPEHSGERDVASWTGIRKKLVNAYRRGGSDTLAGAMMAVQREYGISYSNQQWIIDHKEYTPFKHPEKIIARYGWCTESVSRAEAFDTRLEKFVEHPIERKVRLGSSARKLYTQLVKLGFTDNVTLGNSAALELSHRLLDICNGFEPVSSCKDCGEQEGILRATCPLHAECKKPKTESVPLGENPKLDALMELVDEIGPEQYQIVIWSCRKNFMRLVRDTLDAAGISSCVYSGDQNDKEKADAREGFASGRYRVCVANQQSAAYGVNFMKGCDYMIYACSDSSVEADHQSRHRVLRGQTVRMKYVYRLYMEGSVEERIYSSLNVGEELIGAASTKDIFELRT